MKRKLWIWLLVLASIVLVVDKNPNLIPHLKSTVQEAGVKVQPYLYSLEASVDRKLNGTTQTTTEHQVGSTVTPDESPMKDVSTSNVYYFHFKKDVPQSVRDVFTRAVNTYNATGIVRLIPGQPQTNKNSITFFVYHKKIENIASRTVELGNGGPSSLVINHFAINTAQAGLNLQYPDLSIKDSVAVHELGHALGLAHSSSTKSVMYPMDQGISTLSQGDINGLRAVYRSGK